jgi:hypothetical protein
MAKSRHQRFTGKPSKRRGDARSPLAAVVLPPPKPKLVYGQAFIIMEDEQKNTFEYKAGKWIPHSYSIAECRAEECQVTELAQKVNRMTRYEVRRPV